MIYNNFFLFHYLYMFMILIITIVLVILRKKFNDKIRIPLLILAVIPVLIDFLDFIYYIDNISSLSFFNSLPFYLCDINSLMLVLVIILKKEVLNHYLRFSIIPFTTIAVIFPDVTNGIFSVFDLRIVSFFLSHGITIAVGIAILPLYKIKTIRGLWYSFIILFILSLFSYLMTFIGKNYGYRLNYAFMNYPPNIFMSIIYNIIKVPFLYMIINYFIVYLFSFLILLMYKKIDFTKVKDLIIIKFSRSEDIGLMKRKLYLEYIFFAVTLIFIAVASVICIKVCEKPKEELNSSNESFNINYTKELSLNGYKEFNLETVYTPKVITEGQLNFKSSTEDTKVTYNIKSSSFKIGDKINSGDYLGKDDLGTDIYASNEMVVLDVTDTYIICFAGYVTVLYTYINLNYLSYVQNAKHISVTSDYQTYIDCKIITIDALNLEGSSFYVEIELQSNSYVSIYDNSYVLFYDEFESFTGISKDISLRTLEYGTIIECYIERGNGLEKYQMVVKKKYGKFYMIGDIFLMVDGFKTIIRPDNIEEIYIKIN